MGCLSSEVEHGSRFVCRATACLHHDKNMALPGTMQLEVLLALGSCVDTR